MLNNRNEVSMIRLIVSDLDGTLLQNKSQALTKQALTLIDRLQQHGIIFAAASGRQYPNLYRLFEPISKEMAFLCENGALVMYHETVLAKHTLDRTLGLALMEDIYQQEGCEVLLSGQNTSYLKPKDPAYTYRMEKIVRNNIQIVQSFEEVTEPFLKISVYEKSGIMEHTGPYFINKWKSKLKCTFSGDGWLDFVEPNVNKGTALSELLATLNISPNEVMAFGDHYNDLEMLSIAGYGYCMENAPEEIRNQFFYHTLSVEDTLEEFLSKL